MPEITTADGSAIHYRLDGPARLPVLLFSNSLGTSHRMWDGQARSLAGRFRILRYDTRGHGASDVPPGPYDIARLGRDVIDLLDALGLERVHFCGLSLGGMTGMWLGVNAPRRFHRLALCNTSAHMPPRELWDRRIALSRAGRMEALVDGVIERWFTAAFRERAPEAVAAVHAQFLGTPGEGYAACCEAIREMDQREAVRGVAAPVLVIAGSEDPATPPAHGRLLAGRIPGARYVEIAEAAHLSSIEQPQRFDAALGEFLSG